MPFRQSPLDSGNEDDPFSAAYTGSSVSQDFNVLQTGTLAPLSEVQQFDAGLSNELPLSQQLSSLTSNPMLLAVGAGLLIAVVLAFSGD